jgi:hypothetical protein
VRAACFSRVCTEAARPYLTELASATASSCEENLHDVEFGRADAGLLVRAPATAAVSAERAMSLGPEVVQAGGACPRTAPSRGGSEVDGPSTPLYAGGWPIHHVASPRGKAAKAA